MVAEDRQFIGVWPCYGAETHIVKGKAAGLGDEEIKHALLLLIPTVGFPTFMKAYKMLWELN